MKIRAAPDLSKVPDDDLKRYLSIYLGDVTQLTGGNITFADNMKAVVVGVTFLVANNSLGVPHNLQVVPTGYIKISSTTNLNVFDGSGSNTQTTIFLQSSAAGFAKVLVFV